jgi:hypothetical protein
MVNSCTGECQLAAGFQLSAFTSQLSDPRLSAPSQTLRFARRFAAEAGWFSGDALGLWVSPQNKSMIMAATIGLAPQNRPDSDQIFFTMPLESLSSAGFAKTYFAKSGFQRT